MKIDQQNIDLIFLSQNVKIFLFGMAAMRAGPLRARQTWVRKAEARQLNK